MINRSEIIHQNFITRLKGSELPSIDKREHKMSAIEMIDIFESQIISRLLDIVSRRLSKWKQSFYTIGSSGHEGNAVLGKVFRINDPAFLHYRSAAFAIQRSKESPGNTPIYDNLLAFTASKEDPISGGRHKVIGSKPLWIPPQTSTIASHLPKAMGCAHAIGLYPKIKHEDVGLDKSNIVLCSFGDASANHSTALGAINTAAWASFQGVPMPIIFICEDNGIGISTPTPDTWIESNFSQRPGLEYIVCNGLDIRDIFVQAERANAVARKLKKPVFFHFKTIRLMGHAGADTESNYLDQASIDKNETQDPLLYTTAILLQENILSASQILKIYCDMEARIERIAEKALSRPKLTTAKEVKESIWPKANQKTLVEKNHFSHEQRLLNKKQPLAKHINMALHDILVRYDNVLVFGEDIAQKGGVYGVTQGLSKNFGKQRVFNTPLDEQSILGLAIGLAQAGYLPIAEIQYLAYVHNAEDQIRGEAASLSFFSKQQFNNPMVIRIAGFAYQKGFGGHFHNDNSLAVFRDIPGIIVATASNGLDAAGLLHRCVELAYTENKVVILIEPIALYNTLDLHKDGDTLWAKPYTPIGNYDLIQYGEIYQHGNGKDLTIISYANGFYLSSKAERILRQRFGINCTLIDLPWLQPLPKKSILEKLNPSDNILIVDECRKSGSISEALFTLLVENQHIGKLGRICAEDSYIPLGDAAHCVLPSVDNIVQQALKICSNTGCHSMVSGGPL